MAAHSLAELFAVLSSWPSRPRLSPSVAARLVRENVSLPARVVTLSAGDHEAVVRDVAEKGLNPRHFLRAWPEAGRIVASP